MPDQGSSQRLPVMPDEPTSVLASLPAPAADPPSPSPAAVDDRTVISQRPPVLPGATRALPPNELGKLLIGERLNHFELLDYVGGGGMGAVFRARDTMLNRVVALKVLSRDQGADDDTRRRFQNEAQSAARLDHENIARVYYVGEDRGLNYIVFEYIEGNNLRDLVTQHGGPLPLAEAINYTLQVARALEHACSRDVVHRDIKPSNVLITADGRAKLVDMGLARLHQVEHRDDLTASGVTLGTFDYISPEQARDPRVADVRSDIYSLGCTLYYMLTARPPFPDGTVLQKLLQHSSDEPPDPRQFSAEVTDEVAAVVGKMLAKNPRRRYQHPHELIVDLLGVADSLGLNVASWGGTTAAMPVAVPTWVERHLPWMAPVAVLMVAVVLIDWLSASPQSEAPLPLIDPGNVQRASSSTAGASSAAEAGSGVAAGVNRAATGSEQIASAAGRPKMGTTSTAGNEPTTEGGVTPTTGTPDSPSAAKTESETTDANRAAAEPPPRAGLLVVSPTARGPQFYSSLRAACAAARNGDVVELRYNGRREERPLLLQNRRFTVRAGESYKPVVVFRPDDGDPMRYPREMIQVTGGKLSLVNLAIELNVPAPSDIPAQRWTLLALPQGDTIELYNCSITVRNGADQFAAHPDVATIHVRQEASWNGMPNGDGATADEPAHLRLEHCVVRGEAALLRVDDASDVAFTWENGLLATPDWLATIRGSATIGRREPHVRLSLRHVTAVVGGGLCQMLNDLDHPYLPQLDVQLNDNIVAADSGALLIEERGVDDRATYIDYVSWNGERNFYTGFDVQEVWRIDDQNRSDGAQRISATDWETRWGAGREVLPNWGGVVWRRPTLGLAFHDRSPDDYGLEESPDNMARSGASDGRDAGMIPYLLPPMPMTQAAP